MNAENVDILRVAKGLTGPHEHLRPGFVKMAALVPEHLLVFLLRCYHTYPEYKQRVAVVRFAANRQCKFWGKSKFDPDSKEYIEVKSDIARRGNGESMRSNLEVLTSRLRFSKTHSSLMDDPAYETLRHYVERYYA